VIAGGYTEEGLDIQAELPIRHVITPAWRRCCHEKIGLWNVCGSTAFTESGSKTGDLHGIEARAGCNV